MSHVAGPVFAVDRSQLGITTLLTTPWSGAGDLGAGEALLAVDRFAVTANNVTYAVLGKRFHYWDFFPAAAPWGIVPAWGFADVIASKVPGLAVGQRVYG